MLSLDRTTAWIGIDQQLVAADLKQGKIAVTLPLTSNVAQILSTSDFTIVLTELEILLFNSDRTIRGIKGLPNIGTEIALQQTNLVIHLLDGEQLNLDLGTGQFKEPAIAA